MTPINLDKLERIARSASKKWSSQVWCGEASPQWTAIGPVHGQKESEWELDPDSSAGRKAETDSKFIGRFSPSVALSLIAEVRRLREVLGLIADSNHGVDCDQISDKIAREALKVGK